MKLNVHVMEIRLGISFLVLSVDGIPTTSVSHNRDEKMEYRRFHHLEEPGKESCHDCETLAGRPCTYWDVDQPLNMSEEEWRRWEIVSLLEQAKVETDEATITRLIEEARAEG